LLVALPQVFGLILEGIRNLLLLGQLGLKVVLHPRCAVGFALRLLRTRLQHVVLLSQLKHLVLCNSKTRDITTPLRSKYNGDEDEEGVNNNVAQMGGGSMEWSL
jgi:hypothetical protein